MSVEKVFNNCVLSIHKLSNEIEDDKVKLQWHNNVTADLFREYDFLMAHVLKRAWRTPELEREIYLKEKCTRNNLLEGQHRAINIYKKELEYSLRRNSIMNINLLVKKYRLTDYLIYNIIKYL